MHPILSILFGLISNDFFKSVNDSWDKLRFILHKPLNLNDSLLEGLSLSSIALEKYFKGLFSEVEINYYGFLTLAFLPFYKSPKESRFFNFLVKIDKIIFRVPFFKFLAWSVLIEARKN